jgi:hypothetical protein|tara:strand:- start:6809 stop:7891 length:1083 start_codon:yes stop_codon:yes gene_type:complete
MADNIQVVHLADNINAAFDKINENFELVATGAFGGGGDSSSTDYSDLEAGILANATAITGIGTSITNIGGNISIVSSQYTDLSATIDGLVLGGIDSGVLTSAIATANTQLVARIDATENSISVLSGDYTNLNVSLNQILSDGITLTPEQVTSAVGGALEALTTRINLDSDRLVIEGQKIVDLTAEVFTVDADGNTVNAISNATNLLQQSINIVNGRIYSADAIMKTELESKIGTDIATATSTLQTQINNLGGTTATWNLDLVAGTESNPHIAGIKFGNDGATADFALTADTFRIVNATNNEIQPFTVSGNDVYLSNATVTGGLNIGSNLSGAHMEITNDTTKIYDENGQLRVQLGNLAGL